MTIPPTDAFTPSRPAVPSVVRSFAWWMRTAIRGQVSSPKALLNTLLHEFCHHLDCTRLSCPESFHTRGFFWRIDHLYHHALGTPPDRRKPLRWIRRGSVWQIDWAKLRA